VREGWGRNYIKGQGREGGERGRGEREGGERGRGEREGGERGRGEREERRGEGGVREGGMGREGGSIQCSGNINYSFILSMEKHFRQLIHIFTFTSSLT